MLRLKRDFTIAVVEAKASYKNPGDGIQQAKEYAEMLGLKFAYSTNGHGIVEHDYFTGIDKDLETFPSPEELWTRIRRAESIVNDLTANRIISPCYHLSGKTPRYYQEIAINRTIQAVLNGKQRILLNMATGTGKTVVVFQIIWKLWNTRWTRTGEDRRPKILYLADRRGEFPPTIRIVKCFNEDANKNEVTLCEIDQTVTREKDEWLFIYNDKKYNVFEQEHTDLFLSYPTKLNINIPSEFMMLRNLVYKNIKKELSAVFEYLSRQYSVTTEKGFNSLINS